jgi:hypothetical protein
MELTLREQLLLTRYETASKRIAQQLTTSNGGSQAESVYNVAYQDLVKAGLAMQIKRKYRGR